jgi:hypothetical protein
LSAKDLLEDLAGTGDLNLATVLGLPELLADPRVVRSLRAYLFPSGRIEFLELSVRDQAVDDDLADRLESYGFFPSSVDVPPSATTWRDWVYEPGQ